MKMSIQNTWYKGKKMNIKTIVEIVKWLLLIALTISFIHSNIKQDIIIDRLDIMETQCIKGWGNDTKEDK